MIIFRCFELDWEQIGANLVRRTLCALFFIGVFCRLAEAQQSEAEILSTLETIQDNPSATLEDLEVANELIQRVVDEFPSSDAAVSILLGETYEGIDFSSFEKRLQATSQTETTVPRADAEIETAVSCLTAAIADRSGIDMVVNFAVDRNGDLSGLPEIIEPANPGSQARLQYLSVVEVLEECAPYDNETAGAVMQLSMTDDSSLSVLPTALSIEDTDLAPEPESIDTAATLPPGSEATEKQLNLDRQAIRDVQARLLVIGFDPNGIDGVVGGGTRTAIQAWQSSVGAEASGFFNTAQLAALKNQSQTSLDTWLLEDENANLYDPPLLALSPRNMSGNWRYTTNCGSGSRLGRMKITGTLSMRHAGGQNYTGTLSNSQGLKGRVSATLSGRSVSSVTNFGLLIGKVSLQARVDDYRLVLRGRDSNGCSFYASK